MADTTMCLPAGKSDARSRPGFTLIELLAMVSIIGILVALLLPAIQASRESARRTQCKNNLKQLAVAFWSHETAHGHFPTGGWGFKWVGEPDAGYGKDQPGSWAYNILAYLEQRELRELGSGIANRFVDPMNAERQAALMRLVSTVLPVFSCPSKRPSELWPYAEDPLNPSLAVNLFSCRYADGCRVARGDYRVNSGNKNAGDQPGPGLIQNPSIYPWSFERPGAQNGICYQRSTVQVAQIIDGTSKTAMIGEKYLNSNRYFDGRDSADDQCVYTGHDRDNAGYTANGTSPMPPQMDQPALSLSFYFGSAHPNGFNLAFCDGSVQQISYEIDNEVWRRYGGRDDELL